MFLKEIFFIYVTELEETYEEDLAQDAKGIINALSPWELDEWVAVEYGNTWYPGIVNEVFPVG